MNYIEGAQKQWSSMSIIARQTLLARLQLPLHWAQSDVLYFDMSRFISDMLVQNYAYWERVRKEKQ